MAESKRTTQAVLWSALLHVGVAAFLFLTTLSCTKWEGVFTAFGFSQSWNPMSCTAPLSLSGPVINATLVGVTRAPLPPPTKSKSAQPAQPEPPKKAPPPKPAQKPQQPVQPPPPPQQQAAKPAQKQPKPEPTPIKTLPAPARHPDLRDQQKAVELAKEKAEQAKRVQEEKEKQHMAELQAQREKQEQEKQQRAEAEAKRKQELERQKQQQAELAAKRAQQQKQQELEAKQRQQKLDEIFKQLDAARKNRQSADKASERAAKAMDAKDQNQTKAPPTVATENAAKPQSGDNGTAKAAYIAALQNAVTQAWLRPDNIPSGTVCPIHIVQIPGGQVVSVKVEPSCPFDAAGRRSVKNAVLRAEPLPYKGFEDVFRTDITFEFTVK